jgi:hypothetical protein
MTGLFRDEVFDEASTGHDSGTIAARAARVHVRTLPPAIVRPYQPKANLIFDDMRRQIDLHVQGPPKGDSHRRAVRHCRPLAGHGAL